MESSRSPRGVRWSASVCLPIVGLYRDPVTAEVIDLIGQIVTRYNEEYQEQASRHDLTVLQARALILVDEPISMKDLAIRLRSEPQSVTGIVDRLAARGLVERRDHAPDRRVKMISITDSGQAIAKDFKDSLDFAAEPLSTLNEGERRALRDLLRRMRMALVAPSTD